MCVCHLEASNVSVVSEYDYETGVIRRLFVEFSESVRNL